MKNRKEYIKIMKKLLQIQKDGNNRNTPIDKDDYSLIDEMIGLEFLNNTAFVKFESGNAGIVRYDYTGKYPLTPKGKKFFEMGWYQNLKESNGYQLIRDIAAFIGAAAGIVIGIIKVVND